MNLVTKHHVHNYVRKYIEAFIRLVSTWINSIWHEAIYIFILHSGVVSPQPNHYMGKGLLYDIILICTRGMQFIMVLNDIHSV